MAQARRPTLGRRGLSARRPTSYSRRVCYMRRYTILRDLRGTPTAEPFAPVTRGLGGLGLPTAAPEPKVDVASRTPRDAQSLARDPTVRRRAPLMPTKLIQPVAIDVGAATLVSGHISQSGL